MACSKFLISFAASMVLFFCSSFTLCASEYQSWDVQPAYEVPTIPQNTGIDPHSLASAPQPGIPSDYNQALFYTQPNIMNNISFINNLPPQNLGPVLPPANILDKIEEEETLRRAGEITYPEFSATQSFPVKNNN